MFVSTNNQSCDHCCTIHLKNLVIVLVNWNTTNMQMKKETNVDNLRYFTVPCNKDKHLSCKWQKKPKIKF